MVDCHRDCRSTTRKSLIGRYYDPATEQFLSVDPLVNETGTPYAFTDGDPVNGSDPSGLMIGHPDEGGLTVQQIMADPGVVENMSVNQVQAALEGTPGWQETRLYRGPNAGSGWAFRIKPR